MGKIIIREAPPPWAASTQIERRGPAHVLGLGGAPTGSASARGSTYWKRLMRCPQEHAFHELVQLRGKYDDEALTAGFLYHHALEAYYGTHQNVQRELTRQQLLTASIWRGQSEAEAAAWASIAPVRDEPGYNVAFSSTIPSTWETVEKLLAGYFDQYRREERFRVLSTEETLHYTDPRTGLDYSARLDLIVECFERGGMWIVEHKCLTGDATIWIPGRGFVRMDALSNAGSVGMVGYDEARREHVSDRMTVEPNGVQDIWRLKLDNGVVLRGTDNHPVFTAAGWQPLGALQAGTWVALSSQILDDGRKFSFGAQGLATLAGYFIGDGTTSSVRFTQNIGPVFNDCCSLLSMRGWCGKVTRPVPPDLRGVVQGLAPWRAQLRAWGLAKCRAAEKFIPRALLDAPLKEAASLLGALWSTDGCIDVFNEVRGSKSQQKVRVCYTTRSAQLARDVQTLLQRFGIEASSRSSSVAYKGERRTYWQVKITSRFAKRFFIEALLAGEIRSVKYTEEVLRVALAAIKPGDDRAVPLAWAGVERMRAAGMRVRPDRASAVTRESLAAHGIVLDDGLAWAQVESVFTDGREMTYSAHVEKTHVHTTNGIVTHNSARNITTDLLEGYQLDLQILGQFWLMRKCVDLAGLPPLKGVIVNIGTKQKTPRFDRVVVCPSDQHLIAFERAMETWTTVSAVYAQLGYPRAFGKCIGPDRGYRRCSYFDLCHAYPLRGTDEWLVEPDPPDGFLKIDNETSALLESVEDGEG